MCVFFNNILVLCVQSLLVGGIFFVRAAELVVFADVIEACTDEGGAVDLVHEDLTSSDNSEYDIIDRVSAVYIQVIANNFISNSDRFANWVNIVSW